MSIHISHPMTFTFPTQFTNSLFSSVRVTLTQGHRQVPQAIIHYQLRNESSETILSATRLQGYVQPPFFGHQIPAPTFSFAPIPLPSPLSIVQAYQMVLKVVLSQNFRCRSFNVIAPPHCLMTGTIEPISEGVTLEWGEKRRSQVVGILHRYQNCVIFAARDVASNAILEIWVKSEWALVKSISKPPFKLTQKLSWKTVVFTLPKSMCSKTPSNERWYSPEHYRWRNVT